MAQAARQSLRMQKELTLLLTDPPPGVSLSNDPSTSSPSSSLTNIDAEIKGPEGTVYANGVFKIKIQIPDRYPFQPPNVTFATPIYHPNIDNGGRICLDILNLPPKGAWQPSLNISTVLMSIGLLLSEPNPDDGLMCEASKEYKYNRQTFDQKAWSMTEKYAKSGSTGSGGTPANPSPLMMEAEGKDLDPRKVENEYNVDHKKLSRVGRKLSLESSVPSQKRNYDDKASSSAVLPIPQIGIYDEQLSVNLTPKFSGARPLRVVNNEEDANNGGASLKELSIGRKLSLHSSSKSSPVALHNKGTSKKCGISKKLSLEPKWEDYDNKENVPPNYQSASKNSSMILQSPQDGKLAVGHKKPLGISKKVDLVSADKLFSSKSMMLPPKKKEDEELLIAESVIVLDSEDSEEEEVKGPTRCRLSFARKPLAGKRKSKT